MVDHLIDFSDVLERSYYKVFQTFVAQLSGLWEVDLWLSMKLL